MKKKRILRITAAIAAFCMTAAMLGGCSKDNTSGNDGTDTSASAESSESEEQTVATQRPVAEGDIYAINKFKVKDVPENYVMADKSQSDLDQHFRYIIDDGHAMMAVYAANYKEDYGTLEDFIGRIRFSMNFNNVMFKCDTEFSEDKSFSVGGFEGLWCDYTITQNAFKIDENGEFVEDENGDNIKIPSAWYTGRLYCFFSDKDAFYFTVEAEQDHWENIVGDFETKILPNIYIDENAENDPITEEDTAETAVVTSDVTEAPAE
ncbi:MAG: hypothetical protein ACI4JK_03540 [Oscillospiraceae bacterium]